MWGRGRGFAFVSKMSDGGNGVEGVDASRSAEKKVAMKKAQDTSLEIDMKKPLRKGGGWGARPGWASFGTWSWQRMERQQGSR